MSPKSLLIGRDLAGSKHIPVNLMYLAIATAKLIDIGSQKVLYNIVRL